MQTLSRMLILMNVVLLLPWGIISAEPNAGLQKVNAFKIPLVQDPPSKYLDLDEWIMVHRYMMPDKHPFKKKLDHMFSSSRVFYDLQSMEAAGFAPAQPQHNTQLIVTRHPELQGLVFKVYLDVQPYFKGMPEQIHWMKRIKGARLIRNSINKHGYQHLFKVPTKWLYLLPDHPSPPSDCIRKLFILVEDDMYICDKIENNKRWRSVVTEEFLDAFFTVITDVSLRDASPTNCPFSFDGRVAFVDTESFHRRPIKHQQVLFRLSANMKKYWLNLFFDKGILRRSDFPLDEQLMTQDINNSEEEF